MINRFLLILGLTFLLASCETATQNALKGDASKAKKLLKWKCKVTFKQLVEEMMKNDLKD